MKKILLLCVFSLYASPFIHADRVDDAVSWMYEKGLTSQEDKISFKFDKGIRRDEAAKFFVNFAKLKGKTTYVKTVDECKFSDINLSRGDLRGNVVASCRLGLLQGKDGKFNPSGQITNAQAIAVLVRLLMGKQDESGIDRSANYYILATENDILRYISMGSKNIPATRGNVGIIIYNARNMSIDNDFTTSIVENNTTVVNNIIKSKPDLVVSVLPDDTKPSPKVGDSPSSYRNVTIENQGNATARFTYNPYDAGKEFQMICSDKNGSMVFGIIVSNLSLAPGETYVRKGVNPIDDRGIFTTAGQKTIYCELDDRNVIDESNENNNKIAVGFTVSPYVEIKKPDLKLMVGPDLLQPNPKVGDSPYSSSWFIDIKNEGNATAEFHYNPNDAGKEFDVICRDGNGLMIFGIFLNDLSLAPGENIYREGISPTGNHSLFESAGTKIMYCMLDDRNVINESNEVNNKNTMGFVVVE